MYNDRYCHTAIQQFYLTFQMNFTSTQSTRRVKINERKTPISMKNNNVRILKKYLNATYHEIQPVR